MLLCEQFSWCHYSRLYVAGYGTQAGYCGDDRLAGTHIALDQPHHRVWLSKILRDLGNDTLLRRGQREWEAFDKRVDAVIPGAECDRGFFAREIAQVSQTEVVGQQFFESETLLTGMLAR